MFVINNDKSIYLTRGDIAQISLNIMDGDEKYVFKVGDVVRFRLISEKKMDSVVLQKDVIIDQETETVDIRFDRHETKIGDIISKPVNYWYEIELNPDTAPQTIIGYDLEGPKIFRLFPEGADSND